MIKIKRVYEEPDPADGERFLIDRVWPRGRSKESVHIDGWMKEVAPSNELRKWYGHVPELWDTFRKRYFEELEREPEAWQPLLAAARRGDITLLYGTRETRYNNAVALQEYLEEKLEKKAAG